MTISTLLAEFFGQRLAGLRGWLLRHGLSPLAVLFPYPYSVLRNIGWPHRSCDHPSDRSIASLEVEPADAVHDDHARHCPRGRPGLKSWGSSVTNSRVSGGSVSFLSLASIGSAGLAASSASFSSAAFPASRRSVRGFIESQRSSQG